MRYRTVYDRRDVSRETAFVCDEGSPVVQSMKDEADINVIVRRFGVTNVAPQTTRTPEYSDYSEVFDFQGSMNLIAQARQSFNELPALVRRRFGNNPQEFLTFVSDPANADEALKLGLANLRPVVDKPVMDVRIVTPPDGPENKGVTNERNVRKSAAAKGASRGSSAGPNEDSE